MSRWLLLVVCIALVIGCHGGARTPSGSPARNGALGLGMVTDVGGLGDKSFNDSAYRGLLRAQSELHADSTVLQSRAVADYEPNLSTLAERGDSLIFAIGFLMHDALDDVAPRFASTHFAIIDSVVDQPNVTSVTFKEEESSFLAGVLAGLVSRTGSVAFLGGVQSPLIEKFKDGFSAGVHSANPKAIILVKYTGSFDDVAAGKEYAGLLFDQGADIVYAAAGKCGIGAIDEVRGRPAGDYIIGVDSDQDALAPGKVLTSALKHVDNAVFALAADAAHGRIPPGHLVLGLKEGGVGLTAMIYTRQALPRGAAATVDAYRRAIISGRFRVPSTADELAAFKPIPPSALR
ncbi:MAG: BMP family ABC transporter substrate-binding protein [Candidatus Eremiobacteraeota bacterium]|nr:BMP family ABC transporter substrate-binding protein [Candidatus Eremiobacteraeota bacterium]